MPDDRALNYASQAPDADGIVTLGNYLPLEGDIVCSKHESEDVHCFGASSNIASVAPPIHLFSPDLP